MWHENSGGCAHGYCAAHDPVYGPSEILPTYDTHGKRVAAIASPGTAFRAFGKGVVDLCGCHTCHALYTSTRDGAA
jgi:hypothetical protein